MEFLKDLFKSSEEKLKDVNKKIVSLNSQISSMETETRKLHATADKRPSDRKGLREGIAKNNELISKLKMELANLQAKKESLESK